MKKKATSIIVVVLLIVAAVSLIGSRYMTEEEKVNAVRYAIPLLDEAEYQYMGESTKYGGCMEFSDGLNKYFIDPNKAYIKFVECANMDCASPEVSVTKEEVEKYAVAVIKTWYPEMETANLVLESEDYNGATYLVTVSEEQNGIPTSFGASLSFLGDGSLYLASFLEPDDALEIASVNVKITENDAIKKAVSAINEALDMHYAAHDVVTEDMLESVVCKKKNFKGRLYYYIETSAGVSVTYADGTKDEFTESYEISIDMSTGQCFELANTRSTGFTR